MKKLLIILVLGISNFAIATDGVLDINATCAGVSCFSGDSLGYPVTITSSGSYRLTSNLVISSTDINVIEISASDVTIDLNGFAIKGPRTCTGFGDSLSCTNTGMTADAINGVAGIARVVIKNGSITGFDTGIALLNGSQNGNWVHHIQAHANEEGILVSNGTISDCQANKNLRRGFGSTHTGLENGSLVVRNSSAYGNKENSAVAHICSNVFFLNNGAGIAADALCSTYTNDSVCQLATCLH